MTVARRVALLLVAAVWSCILPDTAAQMGANSNFGALPAQNEVMSVTTAASDTLRGYFSIARSFIDAVLPDPTPYELFTPWLSGIVGGLLPSADNSNGNTTPPPVAGSIQEILTQFMTWLVPVLVVVALGLLLAVLFTCGGCCLCCCRLGGKCGAKAHEYRSKYQGVKCLVFSFILLLSISMIFLGVVFGFLSNQKFSDSISGFENTASSALQDGVNYLNDTLNQVTFIATDQFNVAADRIVNDIQNIGTVLGGPIRNQLEDDVNSSFQQITNILNTTEMIRDAAHNVNTTVTQLSELQIQLNVSLSELREGLDNLSMSCTAETCDLVPSPDSVNLAVDWSSVGNLTGVFEALDEIDVGGIRTIVGNATQIFNNIDSLLTTQTSNIDISSVLNESREAIQNVIGGVQNTVDNIISDGGVVDQVQDGITTFLGSSGVVLMYDRIRYGVAAGLFSLIALVGLIFSVGAFCGLFGYSREAQTYERSSVSHCGAILLLLGVAMCFLIVGLLLTLTTLFYLLGTALQMVCNDVGPPDYVMFREVTDKPSLWGGRTLVGAVTASTTGLPINVSLTGFLSECENNGPLWQALQADRIIDLNATLSSFTRPLDNLSLGGSIMLPLVLSGGVIPEQSRNMLESIQMNLVGAINFTDYERLLNQRTVNFELEEFYNNLTTIATLQSNMSMEAEANDTLSVRTTLVNVNYTLQEIQEQLDYLQENITVLQTTTQNISVWARQALRELDAVLNRTRDVIARESQLYIERQVENVDDYLDYVQYQAQNEVGRCRPLSAIYGGMYIAVCSETLDGLNGLWFSVGWCVVFFLPAIIFGVIVTTYFRRAPSIIHDFTDDDISESEVYPNNGVDYRRPSVFSLRQNVDLPHTPSTEW